jgi:hypothetical protein
MDEIQLQGYCIIREFQDERDLEQLWKTIVRVFKSGCTASFRRNAREGALPIESNTDNLVCLCFASSISRSPAFDRVELMTGIANAERRTKEANFVCSASLNGFC